jgi:hypothetical protein
MFRKVGLVFGALLLIVAVISFLVLTVLMLWNYWHIWLICFGSYVVGMLLVAKEKK